MEKVYNQVYGNMRLCIRRQNEMTIINRHEVKRENCT